MPCAVLFFFLLVFFYLQPKCIKEKKRKRLCNTFLHKLYNTAGKNYFEVTDFGIDNHCSITDQKHTNGHGSPRIIATKEGPLEGESVSSYCLVMTMGESLGSEDDGVLLDRRKGAMVASNVAPVSKSLTEKDPLMNPVGVFTHVKDS